MCVLGTARMQILICRPIERMANFKTDFDANCNVDLKLFFFVEYYAKI